MNERELEAVREWAKGVGAREKHTCDTLREVRDEYAEHDRVREACNLALQQLVSRRDVIPGLLEEVDARARIIHDMQEEPGAYRMGKDAAYAEILALLREWRGESLRDAPLGKDVQTGEQRTCNVAIEAVLRLAGLDNGESPRMAPPDEVREMNRRMRKALEVIAGQGPGLTAPPNQHERIARRALSADVALAAIGDGDEEADAC